jgi:hypothetical protein
LIGCFVLELDWRGMRGGGEEGRGEGVDERVFGPVRGGGEGVELSGWLASVW